MIVLLVLICLNKYVFPGVGELEVIIREESHAVDDIDPSFDMSGPQGTHWIRGSFPIGARDESFQASILWQVGSFALVLMSF